MSGLTSDVFYEDEERGAFEFMQDYRSRYGICPALNIVELETGIRFPQYDTQNPFEFWFDAFRRYVQHNKVLELFDRGENLLADGQVDDAIEELSAECLELRDFMQPRRRVSRVSDLARVVVDEHGVLQSGLTSAGIFTGFPYLDEVTGGIQPGDMWVLAGEAGSGKTYVACRCMLSAIEAGRSSIFVSMEMPNKQLARRTLSMGSGVSATSFRLGRLSHFAVQQVREYMETWNADYDQRLVMIEGQVNYTVEDVKVKVRELRPAVVFVDGAYMLKTRRSKAEKRWELQIEVVEMLKQMAMSENIAVFATFQFDQKQKVKSLSTIMGGQAVGQIASVVLGLENESGCAGYEPVSYKELTLYKGREGEQGKIRLRYDMNRTIIAQDAVLNGLELENTSESNNSYADI
jgi:replicative DNA helicase